MLHRVMIVVAVALAAAGCTTSNSGTGSEPEATSSPTPTADDGATVDQWASLVATHERSWRDQVETVEEDCLDPELVPACALGYLTLSFMAETMEIEVGSADSDLGEPLAEIADLVDNLIEAAGAVDPAVVAWQDTGCEDPVSLDCGVAESFAMDRAVSDLTQAFDAWAPYL